MTHTPGPLEVDYRPETLEDRQAAGIYYVINAEGAIVAETMIESYAHLIAAAPDLLQALEAVEEETEWDIDLSKKTREMVSKAIRKARGQFEPKKG